MIKETFFPIPLIKN